MDVHFSIPNFLSLKRLVLTELQIQLTLILIFVFLMMIELTFPVRKFFFSDALQNKIIHHENYFYSLFVVILQHSLEGFFFH